MAAPSYTTDLTTLSSASDAVGWAESSNAAWNDGGGPVAENDYLIQGACCVSESLKTGIGSMIYNNATGVTLNSGDVFMAWLTYLATNALADYAAGGMRMIIGDSLADFYSWDVGGADTNIYGGWQCIPVDPERAVDDTVGTPSGTWQYFGTAMNVTGNVLKGNPHGTDALRYGRAEALLTDGESASPATFAGFSACNDTPTNRWGLLQEVDGGYFWQGLMSLGKSGSPVYFNDSGINITVSAPFKVASSFNRIEINDSSSCIIWDAISFTALGASSPGYLEMVANADFDVLGCQFKDMGSFVFGSNASANNSIWRGCSQITACGLPFTNNQVLDYVGPACTAALVWPVDVDLDGKLDGTTFEKGTNAHHAIELGTTSPSNLTVRSCTFSGFAGSDNEDDAVFYVKRSSGSVNIGAVECTGTITYKTDGAAVNITQGVSTQVTVQNAQTGCWLANARVLVEAGAGGPFPYQEAVENLSYAASVVTASHPDHGLGSGDWVVIRGASEGQYNGVWQITVSSASVYTYAVSTSPTSPASGCAVATFAPIHALTSASGLVSDTRTYASDQPFTGRVRADLSGSPYQTQPFSGTIDSATGATVVVGMSED
ncbi:MAG: hypothetical protein ACXABY_02400 [Candidatus Thorarchaeota archaeon]|jgi:hypothetical protein